MCDHPSRSSETLTASFLASARKAVAVGDGEVRQLSALAVTNRVRLELLIWLVLLGSTLATHFPIANRPNNDATSQPPLVMPLVEAFRLLATGTACASWYCFLVVDAAPLSFVE